jgi:hypothetical protein
VIALEHLASRGLEGVLRRLILIGFDVLIAPDILGEEGPRLKGGQVRRRVEDVRKAKTGLFI